MSKYRIETTPERWRAYCAAALAVDRVAEREIGEGSEDAAVADAARVHMLAFDTQPDRHRRAARPAQIERSDQRVERAQARDGAKAALALVRLIQQPCR